MADHSKATAPLGSGFEHGLSVPLPHIELAGVDSYRIVHDAVEDGVGDGVAAETTVPFLGRQLGGERGAGVVVAQFHELEQEPSEPFVGLVHEPFVDREQRIRGVLANELGRTSGILQLPELRHRVLRGLFRLRGDRRVRLVAPPPERFRRYPQILRHLFYRLHLRRIRGPGLRQ